MSNRFLVTTPGLSATRWISFALARHPQVFVAHGKHPLLSIAEGCFQAERSAGDLESFTHGNLAAGFFNSRTVSECFSILEALRSDIAAVGLVHTFTVHELQRRIDAGEVIEDLSIVNVLRHPVSYVASHTSMVRSAERFPESYAHFRELFEAAIESCPELRLIECADASLALAFIVSVWSVSRVEQDLEWKHLRHVKMEDITRQPDLLRSLCESATGLDYGRCDLDEIVAQGAINRHRAGRKAPTPAEIFADWLPWQHDVFRMLVSPKLIEAYVERGYDLSMVEGAPAAPACAPGAAPPCVGDRLNELLPHLQEDRPRLVEAGFRGYDLLRLGREFFAVARSAGVVNAEELKTSDLARLQREGCGFVGNSPETVRRMVLAERPVLVEENVHGFNIVRFRGEFIALAQSAGAIDLSELSDDARDRLNSSGALFTEMAVEPLIESLSQLAARRNSVELIESAFHGYCLLRFAQKFVAVAGTSGVQEPLSLDGKALAQLQFEGHALVEQSLEALRELVLVRPARLIRHDCDGFNILWHRGEYVALRQALGPIDLTTAAPSERSRLESEGNLIRAATLDEAIEAIAELNARLNRVDLIEAGYRGYDLLAFRDEVYAVPQQPAGGDGSTLNGEHLTGLKRHGGCLIGDSIESVRQLVLAQPPRLVQEGCRGFNILWHRGEHFAIWQGVGPIDLASISASDCAALEASGELLRSASRDELESRLAPPRARRSAEPAPAPREPKPIIFRFHRRRTA